MVRSFVTVAPDSTGKKLDTIERVEGANTVHDQVVVVGDARNVLYRGRASTFRTVGRAATTQNLLTIYNASATRLVDVQRIMFDTYSTTIKALTVVPATVRVSRFTAAVTTGTLLGQTSLDTAETSDVNVTTRGDASADGTNSASALTVTIPTGTILTQEFVPRVITAAGIEIADRLEFFVGEPDVTLRQGQGLVVHLAAPVNTAIAAGDGYVVVVDWDEYTLP